MPITLSVDVVQNLRDLSGCGFVCSYPMFASHASVPVGRHCLNLGHQAITLYPMYRSTPVSGLRTVAWLGSVALGWMGCAYLNSCLMHRHKNSTTTMTAGVVVKTPAELAAQEARRRHMRARYWHFSRSTLKEYVNTFRPRYNAQKRLENRQVCLQLIEEYNVLSRKYLKKHIQYVYHVKEQEAMDRKHKAIEKERNKLKLDPPEKDNYISMLRYLSQKLN